MDGEVTMILKCKERLFCGRCGDFMKCCVTKPSVEFRTLMSISHTRTQRTSLF